MLAIVVVVFVFFETSQKDILTHEYIWEVIQPPVVLLNSKKTFGDFDLHTTKISKAVKWTLIVQCICSEFKGKKNENHVWLHLSVCCINYDVFSFF